MRPRHLLCIVPYVLLSGLWKLTVYVYAGANVLRKLWGFVPRYKRQTSAPIAVGKKGPGTT